MFWTDWGEKPRIERAYMDGTNRKVIINRELGLLSFLYFFDIRKLL